MNRRSISVSVVASGVAALLSVSVALADTCCANAAVRFDAPHAQPGATVHISGLVCLDADNSGPLAFNPTAFWLSADQVAADPDPGSVPGSGLAHLANDLPPTEQWLKFAAVANRGAVARGSATFIVPQLDDGTYELWWLCDNGGGPGSGIHYSGGPGFRVGAGIPATDALDAPAADLTGRTTLPLSAVAAWALVFATRRFRGSPGRPGPGLLRPSVLPEERPEHPAEKILTGP